MPSTPAASTPPNESPIVLSYAALRRVVGYVALSLPTAVLIFGRNVCGTRFASSISNYYYTNMGSFFVGSLCSIAMFMFCCRGYSWKDEAAGMFSATCALGVVFCPTRPDCGPVSPLQNILGTVHVCCATALFLTLAYFCLGLFTKTEDPLTRTIDKRRRNVLYVTCGWVILCSLISILITKLLKSPPIFGLLSWLLCFETTSLLAFGVAWLVKGEGVFFLNDSEPTPTQTRTTNKLFGFSRPGDRG